MGKIKVHTNVRNTFPQTKIGLPTRKSSNSNHPKLQVLMLVSGRVYEMS